MVKKPNASGDDFDEGLREPSRCWDIAGGSICSRLEPSVPLQRGAMCLEANIQQDEAVQSKARLPEAPFMRTSGQDCEGIWRLTGDWALRPRASCGAAGLHEMSCL